jgi:outer membrane cobalamin receptor
VRDGVRQNDAYSKGGVGQSYFDTDMIKQVEVAKGPASAAYGSDALGGVIAITTKDASDFIKGIGTYLVDSVIAADTIAVSTCIVVIAAIFVVANFMADIINRLLCPWMVREENDT